MPLQPLCEPDQFIKIYETYLKTDFIIHIWFVSFSIDWLQFPWWVSQSSLALFYQQIQQLELHQRKLCTAHVDN